MPLIVPEYIEVKSSIGAPAAYLSPKADGLREVWSEAQLNGPSTLTLSLPLASEKWAYLTDAYRIIAGGREYVLVKPDAIEASRDGHKLWGKVVAQESWILLNKKFVTVSNDPQTTNPPWGTVKILSGGTPFPGCTAGSAKSALSYVLQGSGWTVGTVDVTGVRDLETEKENVLANVSKIQELWGGYLVWDSLNKVVHLRKETVWQNYTGFQIRYAKNLKHITRTVDYDIVTRLYPFGADDLDISSVNDGKLYLDNFQYTADILEGKYVNQEITDPAELKAKATEVLDKLSKPRYNYRVGLVDLRTLPEYQHENVTLGDMVDVVDEPMGITDRARLIRHKYNLFQPWKCEMEVGDPVESLADTIVDSIVAPNFVNENLKPNASIRNILKGFLDNAVTEINGSGGDYTCVNGVATWKERVDGQLTGKVLRISPAGLGISTDGGQTFVTAATGAGIAASVIIGELIAGGQLTITNEAGNFLVDSAGVQIDDLTLTVTRSDGKSKIVISPTDGIKVQKQGVDKLYADVDGNLVAEDLIANRLIMKSGDDVLIDGVNKKIGLSKFLTILGEVTVDNVPLYQLIQEMNENYQGELSGDVIDELKANKIAAGTITAAISLVAAEITSQSSINVTTDVTIGRKLYMNPASFTSDIIFTIGGVKIYADPAGNGLFLIAPGGVFANNQRIDQPQYVVFE